MTGRRGLATHRATRYFSEVISPVSVEGWRSRTCGLSAPEGPAQLAPPRALPLSGPGTLVLLDRQFVVAQQIVRRRRPGELLGLGAGGHADASARLRIAQPGQRRVQARLVARIEQQPVDPVGDLLHRRPRDRKS